MDAHPVEIIDLVHTFLDPLSNLILALANRQLASHSRDALKLNRQRAEKYRVLDARDGSAVQAILQGPGWGIFVRELEIWDEIWDSVGGAEEIYFLNYEADDEEEGWLDDVVGNLSRSGVYGEDVTHRLRTVVVFGVGLPQYHEQDRGEEGAQRRQLKLQTLLLLCCTRLRALRYLRPRPFDIDEGDVLRMSPDPGPPYVHTLIPSHNDGNGQRTNQQLARPSTAPPHEIIGALHSLSKSIWPSSLISLRQLAIGLPSDEHYGRAISLSMKVLSFFLLPNLNAVYLRGLAVSDSELEALGHPAGANFNVIPNASSLVRHVCLEYCVNENAKFAICNIVRACRNLETLVLSSCEIESDFDWIASELKRWQANSLKTYLPCGDLSQLSGYRGAMYEQFYKEMRVLEVVPLDLDEIVLTAEGLIMNEHCSREEACRRIFAELKADMGDPETLVFHGSMALYSRGKGSEYHRLVDEGFASLVALQEVRPRKLRAVYLDKAVESSVRGGVVGTRALAFPKTRDAAKRCGVQVRRKKGALNRFAEETCRGIFGVELALDELS